MAPAAIWLLFIVVWPTIDTVRLSLFNESATKFLGLTNYKTVFSTDTILTAFRNNVIWVLIFPFFVTTFGLIFAVLTERIRWATAFKALIVMPIVFSTTASALVWATIFDNSPQIGAVNAAALTISDWFNAPGAYPVSTTAGQTVADLVGSNSRAVKNGSSLDQYLLGPGGRDDRYRAEGYQPRDAHRPQGPKGGEAPANVGCHHGCRLARVFTDCSDRYEGHPARRARPSSSSPVARERSGRERRVDHDDHVGPVQILQRRFGEVLRRDRVVQFQFGLYRVSPGSAAAPSHRCRG